MSTIISASGLPDITGFDKNFCVLNISLDLPVMSNRCLDIALPQKPVSEPFAFFFVHGGGWGAGSRGQYYPVMQYVSNHGFAAAATGYRLCKYSPVTAFDQLLDIRQSYMLLVRHLRQTTGNLKPKIVVMGSSAGAHLGSLLAYTSPGQCGEPLQYQDMAVTADEWVAPSALIAVCGTGQMTPWPNIAPEIWNDMQRAVGKDYTPETEHLFQQLSPVNYLSPKSCPTFIIAAEHESLFNNPLNQKWHDKLVQSGVRCELKTYQDQTHGFLYFCETPAQRQALGDAVNFVRSLSI